MKKSFKILYILCLSIFILPILVNASTFLSTNNNNPIVGQDFNVSLNIDYADKKISQASYVISYNNDMFSLKDRMDRNCVLGPTHEELFVNAIATDSS